ncbi:MAG: hypothetical protein JO110_02555 [Acetobacteraceae bacterium]|nr:hypothetical protein [Acetobacteraceae bacterium]
MRIWFAEGPAYSRRTETLFELVYLAAFVAIGAVLPLFGLFRESQRGLAAWAISLFLALLFRLVLRMRAREDGVPFLPAQELRAQRRAWLREKRPLGSALAGGLCKGVLLGLAMAQAKGRPFWESDVFGWAAVIGTAVATIAFEQLMMLKASSFTAFVLSTTAFLTVFLAIVWLARPAAPRPESGLYIGPGSSLVGNHPYSRSAKRAPEFFRNATKARLRSGYPCCLVQAGVRVCLAPSCSDHVLSTTRLTGQ